jgi:hypothetical protein
VRSVRAAEARLRWGLLPALALGCEGPGGGEAGRPREPLTHETGREVAGRGAATLSLNSAIRCAECHEDHAREWRGSRHAAAAEGAIYAAMLKTTADPAGCDRCHSPLKGLVGAGSAVAAEGVGCEACHSISKVAADERGALAASFDVASARKYGPLCDAQDHYFHKMGCSPLHSEGELCGACHELEWPGPKGPLPVFTEFSEWQATAGPTCQSCHMAGRTGEAARGWPGRSERSEHWLLAEGDALAGTGIAAALAVSAGARGELAAAVTVHNSAGHGMPAGLPGRRLTLTLLGLGEDGAVLAEEAVVYARTLGSDGVELPFTAASEVISDSRLASGERRIERWTLPGAVTQVRVRLSESRISPAQALWLGIEAPPERLIDEVSWTAPRRRR